jgi:hypothetical protein
MSVLVATMKTQGPGCGCLHSSRRKRTPRLPRGGGYPAPVKLEGGRNLSFEIDHLVICWVEIVNAIQDGDHEDLPVQGINQVMQALDDKLVCVGGATSLVSGET